MWPKDSRNLQEAAEAFGHARGSAQGGRSTMAPDQQDAPRRRVCRRAVLALALAALPRALRAAADPQAFVAALGGRAFAILEQPTDGPGFRALAALLEEVVDFDLVARLVLGRHWNEASPAQRTAYL